MDQLLLLARRRAAWGSRAQPLAHASVRMPCALASIALRSETQAERHGPLGSRPPNQAYAAPSLFKLLACSHISTTRSRKGQSTNLNIVHQSATVPTFANWSSEIRPWP